MIENKALQIKVGFIRNILKYRKQVKNISIPK